MTYDNSNSTHLIRDNKNRGSVGGFLKDNLNDGNEELSIVSAYFTIYAYNALKEKLDKIKKLQFLFGEPTFIKNIEESKRNMKDFRIDHDKLSMNLEMTLNQKSIAQSCADWIREKVEIKSMVKPNFLHGKMYHIAKENQSNEAIIGSSNFTVNGLGLNGSKNIELNMVVDSKITTLELKKWFEEIWNETPDLIQDVKEEVLKYLEQLYSENQPDFIYHKTLFHIFEKFIDEQNVNMDSFEQSGFYESEIWNMLYDFQKDGVVGAINKIKKHNGCIIADSVGLGKTFEALAVIHYFEKVERASVLVLCPKKLGANWTIYQKHQKNQMNPFKKDRFDYTVMYHTDLGRLKGNSDANGIELENLYWDDFDLVVIDESHNFKGNPLEREDKSGNIRMNRAKWLMEKILKEGRKTKVLLLSATPVNNTLKDLRNQIYYITHDNRQALAESAHIKDIEITLKNAQTNFSHWADPKKNPNRNVKTLLNSLDSSFFKLLDELTIARSRKHITTFYDSTAIGKFPDRLKPIPVDTPLDALDISFTYDQLNEKILGYKLYLFTPTAYILPEKQDYYESLTGKKVKVFTQTDRENSLIGMMKVNFLKRLESSIESFEISMKKTIDKINKLIDELEKYINKTSGADMSYTASYPDEDLDYENEIDSDEWQVGESFTYKFEDMDCLTWLADLKKDKMALGELYNWAHSIDPDRDAKLIKLKKIIENKVKNNINPGNNKALVFTAFSDTALYLYKNCEHWAKNWGLNIAVVTGTKTITSYGRNNFSEILTNFSPKSKKRDLIESINKSSEIDIMIATDCISEGQNLQDCDYLINYDIHWNPVRIIQRFGRIDRLGSINDKIQLVNFWPTKDLDKYINLKLRVESRMALVDITATGNDNLLAVEKLDELIEDDLQFRLKQLKKLKEDVLDLEEMDEGISLTDFTLDDFRVDLTKFLNTNRTILEEAPLGLYAVVPSPGAEYASMLDLNKFSEADKEIIKPGLVFCLRQKGDSSGNEKVNPLQPYFLVYIREDGVVRYNYGNAKQILEIYRLLCQGRFQAYQELCDLFNSETDSGKHMDKYYESLCSAVDAIVRSFKKKAAAVISGIDRGGLLLPPSKIVKEVDNFDLITWLIIK